MISISGFMCLCVLAEADDFFKMIGPLLIFGIYIVGALAKGWTKGRQQDSEEEPSELRKAVQKRYQEIHQRQVGGVEGQAQPPRHTEPAPTTSQRTFPPLPVQAESHRRLVQQPQKPRRQSRRQKPYSVKTQALKSVQKPRTARINEVESTKPRYEAHSLASIIQQPQSLRTAVVLKEILDKPLALRDF
ncbi:MAG: hypothetical protein ACYSOC_07515 [Planctomycetota bacterium]|jgi:hypothetical protein